MSGLVKAKEYDWKDSNMALFGSDTDKQVKKESAETEPAWKGAGQRVGVQIWRIVKFKVTLWPTDEYGRFFNGDSYIILNTYKEKDSDELHYDVHFWIGKYSTQDEYGTAAYKTVELDTLLDDKPIQHREVEGHESSLFKSYFPVFQTMDGGADTGFRHVEPEEYNSRLQRFTYENKKCEIKEVPKKRSNVTSNDVFILDNGLMIYQFNGSSCNVNEKFKAAEYRTILRSERPKAEHEVLEEDDMTDDHPFYAALDTGPDENGACSEEPEEEFEPVLFRMSDASGQMKFENVGAPVKASLDPKDVFVVDNGKEVNVWIGKQASATEKKNAMAYAHNYLKKSSHPLLSVTCVRQGKESKYFWAALSG